MIPLQFLKNFVGASKVFGTASYSRDGANNPAGLLDANGNPIYLGPNVYTWGYHPNPWDVPFGTEILIHPSCLTGSGANTQGIKLRSDNTNWCFADRGQTIYSKSGSLAAPLSSGIAGAGATEVSLYGSLNQLMLPAYLLYKGCRGRFRCKIQKTNANATWSALIRLGTHAAATDVNANDALMNLPGITNASLRQFWVDIEFYVVRAGRTGNGAATGETTAYLITTNSLTSGGNSTDLLKDRNALFSTIDPIYFNINIGAANASDTFSLIEYSLELLP